jgi:hypothetical protein
VIDWGYGFNNHQRRHSAATGLSPINYETAALNRAAAQATLHDSGGTTPDSRMVSRRGAKSAKGE